MLDRASEQVTARTSYDHYKGGFLRLAANSLPLLLRNATQLNLDGWMVCARSRHMCTHTQVGAGEEEDQMEFQFLILFRL